MTTHLILMAGMPGAGKSTIAHALGAALGWPVIDKDVILSAMLPSGIPEEQAQPASYASMLAIGRSLVADQRRSVILDSPASWRSTVDEAEEICRSANAQLHVVLCLADRDTRNTRVRSRVAMRSQPVGFSRTVGTGIERFQHLPEATIQVGTERPLHEAVADVIAHLRTRGIPFGAMPLDAAHIELREAQLADKPVIANLMQLYLHDFSTYSGATPDATGRYSYQYLDAYWTDAGCAEGRVPFLIFANGEPAGFALRTAQTRLDDDAPVSNVAEFFVVRAWRRCGVGRRAAHALFDRFPGHWEVAQLRRNAAARSFWRSVIGAYTNGAFEEQDLADDHWDGIVQAFVSAPER